MLHDCQLWVLCMSVWRLQQSPSLPALCFCSLASNTLNPIATFMKIKLERERAQQSRPVLPSFLGSPSLWRLPWALRETIPQTPVNNASLFCFSFLLEHLQTWTVSTLWQMGKWMRPGRSRQRESREGVERLKTEWKRREKKRQVESSATQWGHQAPRHEEYVGRMFGGGSVIHQRKACLSILPAGEPSLPALPCSNFLHPLSIPLSFSPLSLCLHPYRTFPGVSSTLMPSSKPWATCCASGMVPGHPSACLTCGSPCWVWL